MLKLRARFTFPAIIVFLIAGISFAGSGLYTGLGIEESPLFALLSWLGRLWAIGWWLTDDLSRRRERWIYCPGIFVQAAWPFLLPYYLLKTRGARALIVITVFVAVAFGAAMIGSVIGFVLVAH